MSLVNFSISSLNNRATGNRIVQNREVGRGAGAFRTPWLGLILLSGLLLVTPARALNIVPTFDSSITTLPNAATVEAAISNAIQSFTSVYTNAATINITFYWGATGPFSGGISLGASVTQLRGYSYSQIVTALTAKRSSANDSNAVASLPASDPTGGSSWWVPRAEAKALGMSGLNANDATLDGSVGFASSANYTFDPNNRAVGGAYDFIAVAEHEISEVMGRLYLLNNGITGYAPFDLFRFTSTGVRSLNVSGTGVYFSVDNGASQLKMFFTNASMGDVQDWKSSASPDAFDAFASSGRLEPLSTADYTALDILGYNSNSAPVATSPRLAGQPMGSSGFKLSFTNTPSVSFSIYYSTNTTQAVTNWTLLGSATESPAGHYQFTDPQAMTNRQRYYTVRSP